MSSIIFSEDDRSLELEESDEASQWLNTDIVTRDIDEASAKVEEAGERLCRFIDPYGVLDSGKGSRRPLVILAFDEAHILTELPKRSSWTVFSELCRTLHAIVRKPIFSLFLSTAGCFHRSSPEIKSDPSTDHGIPPLGPITEISFDDLAYPAKEDTVSLSQVVTTDWISHLGCPLCVIHFTYSFRVQLISHLEQVCCLS